DGPTVAGAAKPHVRPLPPAIGKKVVSEAGSDAPAIQAIATSSAYGAPQTTLTQPHQRVAHAQARGAKSKKATPVKATPRPEPTASRAAPASRVVATPKAQTYA